MGYWLLYFAVLGPYTIEYTSNGRYMLVGGRKGHIAMMDMLHMDLIKEFQVNPFTIEAFSCGLDLSLKVHVLILLLCKSFFFLLVWSDASED